MPLIRRAMEHASLTGWLVERDGVKVGLRGLRLGCADDPADADLGDRASRLWKGQVAYLARHFRVVTFDPRGNGRSDRPTEGAPASPPVRSPRTPVAVLDATGTDAAVAVAISLGAGPPAGVGGSAPGSGPRGCVRSPPPLGLRPPTPPTDRPNYSLSPTTSWTPTRDGPSYNRHYWLRDYRRLPEFFFAHVFTEPHSTKQIEDCIGWGLETDPRALISTTQGGSEPDAGESVRELCARVRCPVLVIHGIEDALVV